LPIIPVPRNEATPVFLPGFAPCTIPKAGGGPGGGGVGGGAMTGAGEGLNKLTMHLNEWVVILGPDFKRVILMLDQRLPGPLPPSQLMRGHRIREG